MFTVVAALPGVGAQERLDVLGKLEVLRDDEAETLGSVCARILRFAMFSREEGHRSCVNTSRPQA